MQSKQCPELQTFPLESGPLMRASRWATRSASIFKRMPRSHMRRFALAFIVLPIPALAQQAPPPVQALAAMLQECAAREANARVGAATMQAEIAALKAVNEDSKTQPKPAQDHEAAGK